MNYVKIWSLKRNKIDPPEPLCNLQQALMNAEGRRIQEERDKPLTQEQWWREEGARYHQPSLAEIESAKRKVLTTRAVGTLPVEQRRGPKSVGHMMWLAGVASGKRGRG